eukprot:scaffold7731_cov32-Attheya_sp.AAC.1
MHEEEHEVETVVVEAIPAAPLKPVLPPKIVKPSRVLRGAVHVPKGKGTAASWKKQPKLANRRIMELEAAASDMYQQGAHIHNVGNEGIKTLMKYSEQMQKRLESVSKVKATLKAQLHHEKAERLESVSKIKSTLQAQLQHEKAEKSFTKESRDGTEFRAYQMAEE